MWLLVTHDTDDGDIEILVVKFILNKTANKNEI